MNTTKSEGFCPDGCELRPPDGSGGGAIEELAGRDGAGTAGIDAEARGPDGGGSGIEGNAGALLGEAAGAAAVREVGRAGGAAVAARGAELRSDGITGAGAAAAGARGCSLDERLVP